MTVNKKIAILQSNYIPWKGYFDLIASVDEFILYDDVQYTKNDWRNRNKIKTVKGVEWISIPVGGNIAKKIQEVELPENVWQSKHWKTLQSNYQKAPCFEEIASLIQPIYHQKFRYLSDINRAFIEIICHYLGIKTKITSVSDYETGEGQTDRLVQLCMQTNADEYISGPAAKNYLDETLFSEKNIKVQWFNYDGYKEYPQLWGEFTHEVSVLDLLFNCGSEAPRYMRYVL